jgi:hypothetical protein
MLTRQFPQPLLNLAIISPASIPATRSRHRHQLADVGLAGPELLQQARHFRSPCYELREFFGSPTAACPCPDSDRQPASSAAVLIVQVLDLFGFAHFHAALLRLTGMDGLLADALFRNPVT